MIDLVNNHVLFPHPANWRTQPSWKRSWQTEVASAVTGDESRTALRAKPRVALTSLITPWTIQIQNRLDDRIRAAKKSGLACMPYVGRGSVLSQDCTADSPVLVFTSAFWTWAVGDYVFFRFDLRAETYEVRQITGHDGVTRKWTLDQAPAQTVKAGSICWPLIFGEFSCAVMEAQTGQRGAVAITVSEMVSPASATIGVLNPVAAEGIGAMAINDDFEVGAE